MSEPAISDDLATGLRQAHSDGSSVWIHDDQMCIARFGRAGYEVYDRARPENLIAHRPGGDLESWNAFCADVVRHHGYTIPTCDVPTRFHDVIKVEKPQVVSVPLARISMDRNPMIYSVWQRDPTDHATIARFVATGDVAADFMPLDDRDDAPPFWDARRIAYFVIHYDPTPIEIEITSNHGHYELPDGFHRLTAAIYRNDARINVVITGDPDGCNLMFPDRSEILVTALDIKNQR